MHADNTAIPPDPEQITIRLSVHYTPDEARAWLDAPHPQLGCERAIDLIRNGRAAEVLAVIDRLDHAVFV